MFSRGLGDEMDELGVAFHWVAPDGSSVLALQQLAHYGNFADISGRRRRRGPGTGDRSSGSGRALERAGMHEVVLCNGTDHWRIQPEMPAGCAELERRFAGSTFAIAQYGEYVSGLQTGEVPSWTGELLGSRIQNVLRGVNSARLYLKQANERAEQRLLSSRDARRAGRAGAAAGGSRSRTSPSRGGSCSNASPTTRSAAARATRFTAT